MEFVAGKRVLAGLFSLIILLSPCLAVGQGQQVATNAFFDMSLEDLMNVEVVSLSKKKESAATLPAAVYVISAEDISRSTARTVPELLRMVPGLHVARVDKKTFSVSSRGFSGRYSNKLLVLIDGRSMYTPTFGGVYWNLIDMLLEDVERIEIIRGPGGVAWGANAVNGVINVITKGASETTGSYVEGGGGTQERHFSGARIGAALGDSGSGRIWAKHYNRANGESSLGGDAFDQTEGVLSGFAAEFELGRQDRLLLSGDLFNIDSRTAVLVPVPGSATGSVVQGPVDDNGGSASARWEHSDDDLGNISGQFYFLRHRRESENLQHSLNTYDIEFQHELPSFGRHSIIWGGGYRQIDDRIDAGQVQYLPRSRAIHHENIFINDTITLIPSKLTLSLGSKFEENYYSGMEPQPSARISWTPDEQSTVWASYSKAARTPTRAERDIKANFGTIPLPGGGVSILQAQGSEQIESEDLNAFEVGYRLLVNENLQLDLSTFYFDYDDYATVEVGETGFDPEAGGIVTPLIFDNKGEAQTYGFEGVLTARPADWWQLQAGYSFLKIHMAKDADSTDLVFGEAEERSPEHQVTLRSYVDLSEDVSLDSLLRYVDRLSKDGVDAYLDLDVRLSWEPTGDVEIALIGQNLLHEDHLEFNEGSLAPLASQQERGVYAEFSWHF